MDLQCRALRKHGTNDVDNRYHEKYERIRWTEQNLNVMDDSAIMINMGEYVGSNRIFDHNTRLIIAGEYVGLDRTLCNAQATQLSYIIR